jgi:hypothetical protein
MRDEGALHAKVRIEPQIRLREVDPVAVDDFDELAWHVWKLAFTPADLVWNPISPLSAV